MDQPRLVRPNQTLVSPVLRGNLYIKENGKREGGAPTIFIKADQRPPPIYFLFRLWGGRKLEEPRVVRVHPLGGLLARVVDARVPPADGADVAVGADVDDGDFARAEAPQPLVGAEGAPRVLLRDVVQVEGPAAVLEQGGQVRQLYLALGHRCYVALLASNRARRRTV